MADRFYGLLVGQQMPVQVVEGAATGGAGAQFEFRINDTAYGKKLDAVTALEAIKNYIQTKETTPIA